MHAMPHLPRLSRCLLSAALLALAACAAPAPASPPSEAPLAVSTAANASSTSEAAATQTAPAAPASTSPAITEVPAKTMAQIVHVAGTPLNDLNLVRTEIAPTLLAAQKSPYAPPPDPGCAAVRADLQTLDALLGADLDAPAASAPKPGLLLQGAEAVSSAAVDTVRGAAEGLLPMRAWVRKLSGAEQHSKDLAAAIAAGSFRRAFLRGYAQAAGCPAAVSAAPPPR
jgi:hypothetical protein